MYQSEQIVGVERDGLGDAILHLGWRRRFRRARRSQCRRVRLGRRRPRDGRRGRVGCARAAPSVPPRCADALHVVHTTNGRLKSRAGVDAGGRWDGGAGCELGLFPTRLHRGGLGPLGVVARRRAYRRGGAVGRVGRLARFRREQLGELRLELGDVGRGIVALDDGDLVAQVADLDGAVATLALGFELFRELGLRASVGARSRGTAPR